MTDSTQIIGQLGERSYHWIPILTPEVAWDVIIPAHWVQRDFVLLTPFLSCKTKVEGDRYFRGRKVIRLVSLQTTGVTIPSFWLIFTANFLTIRDPARASIRLLPRYRNFFLGALKRS